MEKGRFPRRLTGALVIVGIAALTGAGLQGRPMGQDGPAAPPIPAELAAKPIVPIPMDAADFWLVPTRKAPSSFAGPAWVMRAALGDLASDKPARALPRFTSAARMKWPLAPYADYYRAVCLLALSRPAAAEAILARLHASLAVAGFLAESVIAREAEAQSALGDHAASARLYEELLARKPASPDAALLALGREYLAAGDRARAAATFTRLSFDYPLSDSAGAAADQLDGLQDALPPMDPAAKTKKQIARAEALFAARRYTDAREAFSSIDPPPAGDAAELVQLRLAECDQFLGRYQAARDRLSPLLDTASRKAEARYFWLSATRGMGDDDAYARLVHDLVTAFPGSSWAEDALNDLATHDILADEDEQADAAFRELYLKFPKGAHATRAAWRAGWWAYTHGRPQVALAYYERAAAAFPHSDYRPAYLYWSGRSREKLGDNAGAAAVYAIVTADYVNSYYGRLAQKRLDAIGKPAAKPAAKLVAKPAASGPTASGPAPAHAAAAPLPSNADTIRLLISLGLYAPARDEVRWAQRTSGDSPILSATLGYVYNKLGAYRLGIVAMKRAYPQYIGQEGDRMPIEALKVIFPLDYWPTIRRYAAAHDLDPYLVAALVNQESAFDATIKSPAGAIGLMQVLPSTGRMYARKLGIRRFSAWSLTNPVINVRIGTKYFADIVARAGGVYLALASYNAGERPVGEWTADWGDADVDEFIDGIPYPETQAYVKKILGAAEDYRWIYAGKRVAEAARPAAKKKAPAAPAQAPDLP